MCNMNTPYYSIHCIVYCIEYLAKSFLLVRSQTKTIEIVIMTNNSDDHFFTDNFHYIE